MTTSPHPPPPPYRNIGSSGSAAVICDNFQLISSDEALKQNLNNSVKMDLNLKTNSSYHELCLSSLVLIKGYQIWKACLQLSASQSYSPHVMIQSANTTTKTDLNYSF